MPFLINSSSFQFGYMIAMLKYSRFSSWFSIHSHQPDNCLQLEMELNESNCTRILIISQFLFGEKCGSLYHNSIEHSPLLFVQTQSFIHLRHCVWWLVTAFKNHVKHFSPLYSQFSEPTNAFTFTRWKKNGHQNMRQFVHLIFFWANISETAIALTVRDEKSFEMLFPFNPKAMLCHNYCDMSAYSGCIY